MEVICDSGKRMNCRRPVGEVAHDATPKTIRHSKLRDLAGELGRIA